MTDMVPPTMIGRLVGRYQFGRPEPHSPGLFKGVDLVARGGDRDLANGQVWLRVIDHLRATHPQLADQVRAWKSFDHPAFAPILELEYGDSAVLGLEADDEAALTLQGAQLLSERLAQGPLDAIDAARITTQLADALHEAYVDGGRHHLGISETVILLRKNGPLVLGPGLPTRFGSIESLADWQYLATEQIASQSDCDQRTDVFSLGVLLFRMLSASFPVDVQNATTVEQLAGQLLMGRRRDLRDGAVDRKLYGLLDVVDRALERDRTRRFSTTLELADAIRNSGAYLPPVPPPIEHEHSEQHAIDVHAPASTTPEVRANALDRTLQPSVRTTSIGRVRSSALSSPEAAPRAESRTAHGAGETPDLTGRVINGMHIERRLGEGGMAFTYLAVRPGLNGRPSVVKVVREKSQTFTERLLQERDVLGDLAAKNVPRVPKIYSDGVLDTGELYIEMELLQGRSLGDILADEGKLEVRRVLHIIDSLCDTLEQIHRAGTYHRDIKPDNIIVAPKGRQKHNIYLIDYGVASVSGPSKRARTALGLIIGTAGYFSPEAAAGTGAMPTDARSDTFGVAATMYELLAGTPAFRGATLEELRIAALQATPPRLDHLRRDVPRAVADLVVDGLAKRPEDRPTVAEFRARLNRIMLDLQLRDENSPIGHMGTHLSSAVPLELPLPDKSTLAKPADEQRRFFERATRTPRSASRRLASLAGLSIVVVASIAVTVSVLRAGRAVSTLRPPSQALGPRTALPLNLNPVPTDPPSQASQTHSAPATPAFPLVSASSAPPSAPATAVSPPSFPSERGASRAASNSGGSVSNRPVTQRRTTISPSKHPEPIHRKSSEDTIDPFESQ